ncbi:MULTISPECIES: RHS repeat-associated core domain-containing protein [unclassified Myroides]|uniref:RHS repeat-associated core domain-containing protein n=1 Tax=unclassified Myroides TaxID=2642485 RepID=UPI0025766D2C|nr:MULTISPECIES: RHS repeat-associated core domain-containing protein [unclassified Myroides]
MAHYYDPTMSVFLSVDPLAEQTMEPYSYVGNNPIRYTDSTGKKKNIQELIKDNNDSNINPISVSRRFCVKVKYR